MATKRTFISYFSIPKGTNVEFVNIPLDEDLEAFICPFLAINNRPHPLFNAVHSKMEGFLTYLNRNFVLPNNRTGGISFLTNLHEPNEFHLGYSDANRGKAIAKSKAEIIFDSLRSNRFARTGVTITNEAHNVLLLVKGIGQDNMSDTIANVCRDLFSDFTTQQCLKHSISTQSYTMDYYNTANNQWASRSFDLPYYKGKPIILIPKKMLSGSRAYVNFYNWFIAKHYIAKDLMKQSIDAATESKFIEQLKDGTKKAIIKRIYETYKKSKKDLVDFVTDYSRSLVEFQIYAKEHYPELDLTDLS